MPPAKPQHHFVPLMPACALQIAETEHALEDARSANEKARHVHQVQVQQVQKQESLMKRAATVLGVSKTRSASSRTGSVEAAVEKSKPVQQGSAGSDDAQAQRDEPRRSTLLNRAATLLGISAGKDAGDGAAVRSVRRSASQIAVRPHATLPPLPDGWVEEAHEGRKYYGGYPYASHASPARICCRSGKLIPSVACGSEPRQEGFLVGSSCHARARRATGSN